MTTDLQRNLVSITPARRTAPDLAAIPRAIHDAGFRPGKMWIRALGTPEDLSGDRPTFHIDGWPTRLSVEGPIDAGHGEFEFEVVSKDGALRLLSPR